MVVVEQQKQSWADLAVVAAATATGVVAAETAIGAAKLAGRGIAAAGSYAIDHAQEVALSAAAGAALWKYAGVVNSAARIIVPGYRELGIAVGLGITAYKVASSEAGQEAIQSTLSQLRLSESIGKVSDAFGNLGSSVGSIFSDMASGATGFLNTFNPIPSVAAMAGDAISGFADLASSSINSAAKAVTYYQDSIIAAALAITSASGMSAAAYFAEAQQLRELAAETARVIEIQERQRGSYQTLGQIQQDALAAATRSEELASVATLKTTEEIDKKWQALQQLNAELIRNDQVTPGATAHAKAMFDALAKQKEGILSGRLSEKEITVAPEKETANPISALIDSAMHQLDVLRMGETEAAVAAAIAKGATELEADALRTLLDEKDSLIYANKLQADSEREIAQAQAEAARMHEQTADRIADLKDELAVATGQMTKYEAMQRKLERSGMDPKQAKEIADIRRQIDEANKKDPKAAGSDPGRDRARSAAALIGSAEVAKIFTGGGNKTDDLLKQSNVWLEKIATKDKDNEDEGIKISMVDFGGHG